jgi:hypothetical protein
MDTRTQEFYEHGSVEAAQRTEVDGVTLIRSTQGRFYAASASSPGTLYLLTGFSCQCAGFAYRQTCRHHRALMSALGWTETARESTPARPVLPKGPQGPKADPRRLPAPAKPSKQPEAEPLTVRCSFCNGVGSHPGTVSTGPTSWTYTNVTCEDCHGTGYRTMPNAA